MVSEFAHSHRIRISNATAKDILEIYDYVVEFDSEANADRLVAKIKASIDTRVSIFFQQALRFVFCNLGVSLVQGLQMKLV